MLSCTNVLLILLLSANVWSLANIKDYNRVFNLDTGSLDVYAYYLYESKTDHSVCKQWYLHLFAPSRTEEVQRDFATVGLDILWKIKNKNKTRNHKREVSLAWLLFKIIVT